MKKFLKAKPIIETLVKNGHEAYFVGGAVRDYLLNRPIHDVDIATSAEPQIVQSLFKNVIPVGIEHGTVMIVCKDEAYEVTTFRKESDYSDFRRPNEVTFISNLHEDLKRRDFTMNAIAMTKHFEIIDPFNGRQDIRDKRIRTVGSPVERFKEDPLRILRAVRFVAQLNFSIERKTLQAIDEMKAYLAHLSIERMAQEFEKLMLSPNGAKALSLIADHSLHLFLPGLKNCQLEIKIIAKHPIRHLKEAREAWALLLYFIDEEPRTFLKMWKRSNQIMKQVEALLHALNRKTSNDPWDPYLFYTLGEELGRSYAILYSIIHRQPVQENMEKFNAIYSQLPIKCRKDLAVDGNDLIAAANKKPGPWIKEALTHVEQLIISGKLNNDKQKIRKWVKHWHNQSEKNC